MKKIIFILILSFLFSCGKDEKGYSQVILNYKLFSLNVNIDDNYILFSRRQGFKELGYFPPPLLDESSSKEETDSIRNVYKTEFALPKTKIYKISDAESEEIQNIIASFKKEDLEGTVKMPAFHCPIFNLILIKNNNEVFDVENQCYYTKNQEKLKSKIFDISIKNENDSLNLSILKRVKNLQPHE